MWDKQPFTQIFGPQKILLQCSQNAGAMCMKGHIDNILYHFDPITFPCGHGPKMDSRLCRL